MDSKAALECKKICVCIYMGESGALHVFKSSNSSAVKAAFQESGEAVQGTLTAALMAKVDFQQLTSPQTRYQLEVWGSLLVSFFLQPQLSAAASQERLTSTSTTRGLSRAQEDFLLHPDLPCLRQHRESCLVRNQQVRTKSWWVLVGIEIWKKMCHWQP